MTSFLAAVKLGCPFVPLNPKVVGNKTEVEHMLRVSEARIVLVGDGDVAEKLEVAVPELMEEMVLRVVAAQGKSHGPDRWVGFRELFETSLADNRAVNDLEDRQESGEDVALVAFTSGEFMVRRREEHWLIFPRHDIATERRSTHF
jgi:acyl-coenzyme A synthetase/AMP-(fatty) acid ligase